MSDPTDDAFDRELATWIGTAPFGIVSVPGKFMRELCDDIQRLRAERDKLQAFKNWTHSFLDGKGIPHHPPGTHGAAGCRIGDRMDYVFAEMYRLRTDLAAAVSLLRECRPHVEKQVPGDTYPYMAKHLLARISAILEAPKESAK